MDAGGLNVVLLLGAGASKEAGCPLVTDFVESFPAYLASKPDADRLSAAYSWLIKQLETAPMAYVGRQALDVELILHALQQIRLRVENPLSAFVTQWNAGLRRHELALAQVEGALYEHIREQCTVTRERVDYLRPIGDFAQLGSGPLEIFTLNYDCTLELLCQDLGIRYSDGFALYWDPENQFHQQNAINLYKIHGSLLWYQTKRPPRRLVKIPVKAVGPESAVTFFTDDDVATSIIYPALTKEQHTEPYSTLLGKLRSAIPAADVVIAIGYSFRDAYLKDLIIEKIEESRNTRLLLVCPDAIDVLEESDAISGLSKFRAIADRVVAIPQTTGASLKDGALVQHVQRLTESWAAMRAVQADRLRRDRSDIIHPAAEVLLRLVRQNDVGAVCALLDDDGDEAWHIGLLAEHQVLDLVRAVLATRNASEGIMRRAYSTIFDRFERLGGRYIVYQTPSSDRRAIGTELESVIHDHIDSWSRSIAETAEETLRDLRRWAEQTRWHDIERSEIFSELANDFDLVARYFRLIRSNGYYRHTHHQKRTSARTSLMVLQETTDIPWPGICEVTDAIQERFVSGRGQNSPIGDELRRRMNVRV